MKLASKQVTTRLFTLAVPMMPVAFATLQVSPMGELRTDTA